MSKTTDALIGMGIKLWLSLILIFCAVSARCEEGKHRSVNQTITDDAARIKAVDCDYVVGMDDSHHVSIVVKVIKVFVDNTTKHEYLTTVFHNRKNAYGACGEWQDQIGQAHSIALQSKQVQ